MSESNTTRLTLHRWSAGTDSPNRAEFDTNFANLETLTAIYKQGTFAARPAAGVVGTFYWDTTNKYEWYDDGSSWNLTAQKTQDATVASSTAGNVALTVNAITGQTANLIDAQVNASSKFSVSAAGSVTGNIFNGKSASLLNDTAANVGLLIKGAASQSANLITAQNNASANQFAVSPAGLITSTSFSTAGSGTTTSTVVNAATSTSVANQSVWSGTPSFEVRMNRGTNFNDFVLLKHDVADVAVANRYLGILMKVGAEDATGAARSAAMYMRSTIASFGSPSLRFDVQDTNIWDLNPSTGSFTPFVVWTSSYLRAAPTGTGGIRSSNTWIGAQDGGNDMYFRAAGTTDGFLWYAGGTHSDTSGDPGGGNTLATLSVTTNSTGLMTVGRLNISDPTEIDLSASSPGLQIGASNGLNLIFDADEILNRNNGAAAELQIQHNTGSSLRLGTFDAKVYINDIRIHLSNNGTNPVGIVDGDLWIRSQSVANGGGLYTRQGGAWVKL